jgi:hypothetical protein
MLRPSSGAYALFRWDLLPHTLVFDFKDYEVQDRFLKRLAFFAEKPGFRGRLAPDREIAALHAWNAHDYPTATLAAFYELARTTAFPLNAEENELLELLLRYGVLERQGDASLREGRGAIISVARESPDWQRRTFMDHEAAHGLFFQDADYRTLAEGLWDALGQESRQFWLEHLAWRNYDVSHKYLNYNELQAYLVQQSVSRVEAYLGDNVLVRLSAAYPQRAQRYAADKARILRDASADAARLDPISASAGDSARAPSEGSGSLLKLLVYERYAPGQHLRKHAPHALHIGAGFPPEGRYARQQGGPNIPVAALQCLNILCRLGGAGVGRRLGQSQELATVGA